jgi:phosphoglucosamine mutase
MTLFGTSGIRRLADRELVELALQVGLAVGTLYKNVIVGRDTRTSGSAIRHAVTAGLLAAGARYADAGMAPTPTIAYVTREFEAGIMITASHNPPQYNGLKLLNPDGSAFSTQQQREVEELVSSDKLQVPNVCWERMTEGEVYSTAVEKHTARILQDFPGGIKVKVVVDCGYGAAYFISPHMLTQLGCEVIPLNCTANGVFPHDVEPIEANLGDLMTAVKENGADLGIAHDGDADRMMAVDDRGRFVSGDKMLVVLSRQFPSRERKMGDGGEIVTTIDASMCIEEMGFKVKRTKVGDPYVSEELKKGAGFGGEPSGAWVFPQISLCPDGIYGAAQIAAIASREKLSELVDSVPSYPVIRGSVAGTIPDMTALADKLAKELKPESVITIDGIKLNFKEGWLLIRPSGTEPKIRVTAEAKDDLTARHYYDNGAQIINSCIKL